MKLSLSFLTCLILLLTVSGLAQSETEKGVELYRKGSFDEAIAILQNVVNADKKDREAWTYLGAGLAKEGKDKGALKAFQKADSISSKTPATDGLKITSKPRPWYTDLARERQTEGRVSLAVEFGGDGKVKIIFVIQALPYGLTESCIQAARRIVFKPAEINGKPVSSVKIIEYSFTLY